MLIQYLAMVIIGGLGSVLGCFPRRSVRRRAAAPDQHRATQAAVPASDWAARSSTFRSALFGVVMLLFLILEPRGLAGIWARVRFYFELWPFKYRAWDS